MAVGVIRRVSATGQQEILLSKRLQHLHQGGLWEFPGGKVESGESIQMALQRELHEELGIGISVDGSALHPLIQIAYDYPDKQVLLDVWAIDEFTGEPSGLEGQTVRWVALNQLGDYDFPAANAPIISACQLPSLLPITPAGNTIEEVLSYLENLKGELVSQVILRQKALGLDRYLVLAEKALKCFEDSTVELILHGDPEQLGRYFDCPVHMPASIAMQKTSPLGGSAKHSMSCHTAQELGHAEDLGLRFAMLSPVLATPSHPDATPLGWNRFSELLKACKIPVYALGGMRQSDLHEARQSGAQGIAGISAWKL